MAVELPRSALLVALALGCAGVALLLKDSTALLFVSAPVTTTSGLLASSVPLPSRHIPPRTVPFNAVPHSNSEAPTADPASATTSIRTGVVATASFLLAGLVSFVTARRSAPSIATFATSGATNGWSLVMSESELAKEPNGQARKTVDGVDLMVVKEGAKVYAVQARCSHLPLKLLGSKVENGVITCSKHGSKFDAATGAVKEWLPGDGLNSMLRMASSQPCPLKAYPTQVKDGNVYVNVTEAKVAMLSTTGEKSEPETIAAFATSGAPAGWSLVMSESELAKEPNGQARKTVDGVDLMVVKDGAKLYAVQARCSHLPLKLLGSKVENGVITCSKHGSKFDAASGQVKEWLPGGGINNVLRLASPEPCGLKAYQVMAKDGNIYVNVRQ